jgi:hypothetical protein
MSAYEWLAFGMGVIMVVAIGGAALYMAWSAANATRQKKS